MTSGQIGAAVAGVVLVCWIVGAYNRLVSLRNVLVERFDAIDALCRSRHALLERQLELLATALAGARPRLDALDAAARQADAARARAQARATAASAVTSLRVAEEILADARARLPVQTMGGDELSGVHARLASDDAALAFARREFNTAVDRYNTAVRQFPTVLVSWLFGFHAGGTL